MATRPAAAKKAAAKPPAAPAPKPRLSPPLVVTLKAIFEQLVETHTVPKKQAHELLADFVSAMTTHLEENA